jgi:hypothetical protein
VDTAREGPSNSDRNVLQICRYGWFLRGMKEPYQPQEAQHFI